jgi:chitinase
MRVTFRALIALVLAGCGGSGGLIGQDYSSSFAGNWTGNLTVSLYPNAGPFSLEVSVTGRNALSLADICSHQNGLPATVTGPATFAVAAHACPPATFLDCPTTTFTIDSGSGTLAGDVLTMNLSGSYSGCSRTYPVTAQFTGTRTSAGSPNASPPTVSLRDTQYANTGEAAALDASGSKPGSGTGSLTFAWNLSSAPAGSVATLQDASAPIAHLTPDRPGDYMVSVTVKQGTAFATGALRLSVFDPVTPIAFRPTDAEYSRALDRIIAVSASPDQLHIFDPLTHQDTAVALPLAARCLSVSPDGLFAAVGHDAWLSYVDLSAAKVLATYAVTADAGDVVISDPIALVDRTTRFAYVFPARDQWVAIHDVDLGTGAEKTSGGLVYAGMRARLQPGTGHLFGVTGGLSPQQMYRFDIGADGITGNGVGSPYWGDYPFGAGIWISADGAQILGGAGNRFRTTDMTYAGKTTLNAALLSADWSAQAGRWIVQPSGTYYGTQPVADTSFYTVDTDYLASPQETAYPRFVHAGDGHLIHGRYVFFDRAGTKRIAIVQVDATSNLITDYAVLVF